MRRKKLPALLLALIMAVSLAVPVFAADDVKTITVLQTSDLHGMVNPFDYAANKESKTSLAHAAAIIAAERKADPNLLLVDTGDAEVDKMLSGYIRVIVDYQEEQMCRIGTE